jgi:hypothetical protein
VPHSRAGTRWGRRGRVLAEQVGEEGGQVGGGAVLEGPGGTVLEFVGGGGGLVSHCSAAASSSVPAEARPKLVTAVEATCGLWPVSTCVLIQFREVVSATARMASRRARRWRVSASGEERRRRSSPVISVRTCGAVRNSHVSSTLPSTALAG